jgi:hypothetical protein
VPPNAQADSIDLDPPPWLDDAPEPDDEPDLGADSWQDVVPATPHGPMRANGHQTEAVARAGASLWSAAADDDGDRDLFPPGRYADLV